MNSRDFAMFYVALEFFKVLNFIHYFLLFLRFISMPHPTVFIRPLPLCFHAAGHFRG